MFKITGKRGRYLVVLHARTADTVLARFVHRWQAEAYVLGISVGYGREKARQIIFIMGNRTQQKR